MIVNRKTLLAYAPIKNMCIEKHSEHGVTYGLGEAGYDIRIKQEVRFSRNIWDRALRVTEINNNGVITVNEGRFCIASTMEEFQMPTNLTGVVHDKSSWARQGLSVFNTVIEPGWNGFLTLELVYHGDTELIIPAGAAIAQVLFHLNSDDAQYTGRYQNQSDEPVAAKSAT